MFKYILLPAFLLFYLLPFTNAQKVWGLSSMDVLMRNFRSPVLPLPDSVKRYQIIPSIEADPQITSLNRAMVQSAFRLNAFEYDDQRPDLIIYVSVKDYEHNSTLHTRKDTLKRTFYRYEENLTPIISLQLKDRTGKTLLSLKKGSSLYYKTPEKSSEKEAQFIFNKRMSDPAYRKMITDSYQKTLQKWSEDLKNLIDYSDEIISLYSTKNSSPAYLQNLGIMAESLRNRSIRLPASDLRAQVQPNIDFLEDDLKNNDLKSKKNRKRYHATALNLINIYRCIDNYEKAMYYVGIIIREKYATMYTITPHLANIKERFEANEYYKKHKRYIYDDDKKNTLAKLDSLKSIRLIEGSVLLANGEIVKGKLLDLTNNFLAMNVKLQYEKKLNDPVSDKEFSLTEVQEIRIPGWNLEVIPWGNQFHLTEILYESAQTVFCRSLLTTGLKSVALLYTKPFFVCNKNDWKFEQVAGAAPSSSGDTYPNFHRKDLGDCTELSNRIRCGYYAPRQYLSLLVDNDSICNNIHTSDAYSNKPHIRKTKITKTPSLYIGNNTGTNSFNGLFGLTVSKRIQPKVNARLGVGWGFWGARVSAGIKYDLRSDLRFRKGWSFALGYGYNWGAKGETELSYGSSTSIDSTTNDTKSTVNILQLPTSTVNLSIIYNRHFGKRMVFLAELGFAKALQKEPYRVISVQGDAKNIKQAVRAIQPGGLILTIGLSFGL